MDLISEPWPWYITGPLIGLTVPLLLYFGNKQFGISSSMRDVCAAVAPGKVRLFNYDWKASPWRLFFAAGIILGALLVAFVAPTGYEVEISAATKARMMAMGVTDMTGLLPQQLFSWSALTSPTGLIMIIGGGFLVGFGTRYANGCTSGHAIMGLSKLSWGSLIAVIGFFIGGLVVSWLVLPHLIG